MATYTGIKKIKIGDNTFELAIPVEGGQVFYGTIGDYTTSGTVRTYTIANSNFNLTVGNIIVFTWAFQSNIVLTASLSLNVNNTGAKELYDYSGNRMTFSGLNTGYSYTYAAIYDGTKYILLDMTGIYTDALSAASSYYLLGSPGYNQNAQDIPKKHSSASIHVTANSSTSGHTQLRLGNETATSSAGGKEGQIRLYGTTATYYVDLKGGAPSANRTITFPNATGTVALTSDIPSVPTITLNGSSTSSPSFYAPTSAGTSGYYLKSNGSGAPSWTAFPTIPTNTDEKVKATAATASTTYYLVMGSNSGTAETKQYDSRLNFQCTSSIATLSIGSSDRNGKIKLYDSTGGYAATIDVNQLSAARTISLPDKTGTVALTSDIPTVPSNIVNTITTTAGAHSTKSSATGAVSFNVPTKTSHLTNDSGFITSDTKVSISNTEPTSGTWYFPTWHTASSGTGVTLNANDGIQYYSLQGTASALGQAYLKLGNGVASGTAGNKFGGIQIYSTNSGYATLRMSSATTGYTIYLPAKEGTIALTSDLSNYLPLSGGYLTGNLIFEESGATERYIKISNSVAGVALDAAASGNHGLWSYTLSKWLIYGDASNVYVNGTRITPFNTVQRATGTATVNAAQTYTLASLSLAAGKRFLVLGYVSEGVSTTITSSCHIVVTSGTVSVIVGGELTRVSVSSGQGVANWRYIETGSSAVTVAVRCYGYYTTSHTGTGHIVAICLGDV